MTWKEKLCGDPLPWLLEEKDPGVRYLAMKDLPGLPVDKPTLNKARTAAHHDGPISTILSEMHAQGYWAKPGPGYLPKYRSTVWSLIALAQLGGSIQAGSRIQTACTCLLDHTFMNASQISSNGVPSGTVDCLQSNLLAALLDLGCDDPRMEAAFKWMAQTVTGEGLAPPSDRKALRRYYAGKYEPMFRCGANNKLSCAWGAAKVMLAFGKLPLEKRTPLIERAIEDGVDFLFSVDPAKADYPCGYNEKPSRNWWKFGFPVFYVTDILQIAEALTLLGHGTDPRLENAINSILDKQNSNGRWLMEYSYAGKTWVDFGSNKQENKWVKYRAMKTLALR